MKILYYYSKLKIGGAEKSTIRLMNELAKSGHDVTLLLRWNGELESLLLPQIRCIHLKKSSPILAKLGKTGELLNHFTGMISLYYKKFFVLPKEEYDLAVNGLLGYNPEILFKNVRAKCYMQMLRNDVSLTRHYGKTEEYMKKYGTEFQAYLGVSDYVTESFKKCYPELADRAHTVYNILDTIDLNVKRDYPSEYSTDKDVLKIVTVCRLEEKSKGLLRMVHTAKQLNDEFHGKFRWYLVGDGQDKALLCSKLQEAGLEKVMILCGAKKNPLPYYEHADLVAVLSYYEGLCGVVYEAKLMHRPVIATRFSGIDEQIINGENGIIVENNEAAILTGMRKILSNPEEIKKFQINGMPQRLLDNKAKIDKLVGLVKQNER